MIKLNKKANFELQYASLIVCVGIALVAMAPYVQRSISGSWRAGADVIGFGRQYTGLYMSNSGLYNDDTGGEKEDDPGGEQPRTIPYHPPGDVTKWDEYASDEPESHNKHFFPEINVDWHFGSSGQFSITGSVNGGSLDLFGDGGVIIIENPSEDITETGINTETGVINTGGTDLNTNLQDNTLDLDNSQDVNNGNFETHLDNMNIKQ